MWCGQYQESSRRGQILADSLELDWALSLKTMAVTLKKPSAGSPDSRVTWSCSKLADGTGSPSTHCCCLRWEDTWPFSKSCKDFFIMSKIVEGRCWGQCIITFLPWLRSKLNDEGLHFIALLHSIGINLPFESGYVHCSYMQMPLQDQFVSTPVHKYVIWQSKSFIQKGYGLFRTSCRWARPPHGKASELQIGGGSNYLCKVREEECSLHGLPFWTASWVLSQTHAPHLPWNWQELP